MARYACGLLYSNNSLCGLRPACYISLATPHLGVTLEDTHAQIGFVAGLTRLPFAGPLIKAGLQVAGPVVAPLLFRKTACDFLNLDSGGRKKAAMHTASSGSMQLPLGVTAHAQEADDVLATQDAASASHQVANRVSSNPNRSSREASSHFPPSATAAARANAQLAASRSIPPTTSCTTDDSPTRTTRHTRSQLQEDLSPVLLQMTHPHGAYLQALKAFQVRAAYALVRGDAWVSWANASIRHPSQLPNLLPEKEGGGQMHHGHECSKQEQQGPILLESVWDPLPRQPAIGAQAHHHLHQQRQQPCEHSTADEGAIVVNRGQCGGGANGGVANASGSTASAGASSNSSSSSKRNALPAVDKNKGVEARLEYMLSQLQGMSWVQVDVQYSWRPFGSPHQAMQGRGWSNAQRSKPLAAHVTRLLQQQLLNETGSLNFEEAGQHERK